MKGLKKRGGKKLPKAALNMVPDSTMMLPENEKKKKLNKIALMKQHRTSKG